MKIGTQRGSRSVMPSKWSPPNEPRPHRDRSKQAPAHRDPVTPDGVRFGRSGLDDAPPPLPKRWLIFGAGLAASVLATATIVGTRDFSLEADRDPEVADTTESLVDSDYIAPNSIDPEPVGISALTQATGACLGTIRNERIADSTGGLGIPPAASELSVVYQHRSATGAAVAVSDGGLSAMCVAGPQGLFTTSHDVGDTPRPLHQYLRVPGLPGENYTHVLLGEVSEEVTEVEIFMDGTTVGEADVADGYYSAFLQSPFSGELAYVVTSANDETKTLREDGVAVSQPETRSNDSARACLSYLNITVAEPEPYGNRAQGNFDSAYELIAEHTQRDYVFAAATDGATITACVEAPGITWVATHAGEMPAGALIAPLQPTIRSSGTNRAPLVGRVGDSVTAVGVIAADGERIEAHLEDGFYAVMLPATKLPEVTYIVQTDDGETTTIAGQ